MVAIGEKQSARCFVLEVPSGACCRPIPSAVDKAQMEGAQKQGLALVLVALRTLAAKLAL